MKVRSRRLRNHSNRWVVANMVVATFHVDVSILVVYGIRYIRSL